MSAGTADSRSLATARQRVRTALELAARRSPESSSHVVAELGALSAEASALGLRSIAELAQRGSEQARLLATETSAVAACARTLRELGRALDALEREAVAPADAGARPPAKPAAAVNLSGSRPLSIGSSDGDVGLAGTETRSCHELAVLVVDDSPLVVALVCDLLERAGYETRRAEAGDAAIAEVERSAPEVVVADVHMPGFTAAELCARLRAAAGGRTLQILLYSGLPPDQLAVVAREAAADGFVTKEQGLDAIAEAVADAAGRASRKDS